MNPVLEEMGAIVKKCAEEAGLYCLEAKVNPQKSQAMVSVVVDTDSGITLEGVAAVSRLISHRLDEEFPDVLYELHVGSPGIDRPLEYDWQFARHVGRTLRFSVDEEGSRRSYEYRLAGFSEGKLTFTKPDGSSLMFERSMLDHIVVVPEIGRKKS